MNGPVPIDEELDAQVAQLDPAARVVVGIVRAMVAKLQVELQRLRDENADLKRMLFGRSSERLPRIQDEVRRSIEAEELFGDDERDPGDPEPAKPQSDEERKELSKAAAKARRKRARKKSEPERRRRRKLRKDLPVLHEVVPVTPEQLPDGYSREDFRSLGEGEVLRRVDHVREHLVVVKYVREKLASKDGEHIVTAETPPTVADGSHYGPGVYALVATDKCADSLPLYRIARKLERAGCRIARSTLCTMFHRAAELLAPIHERLLNIARADPYLNGDETTLPVQERGGCHRGYIWTLVTAQIIAYEYSRTRAKDFAIELLSGTRGYLQVDGYAGYDDVCGDDGRTRVGCWAHLRRKFYKALGSAPEAREALDLIVELYKVEHKAAEREILGTPAHAELRRAQSAPIIARIEKWLTEQKPMHSPKSTLGDAIGYATNQWQTLIAFLDDPKLSLDNNISERALRIIAIGRKNYLFAGHDEGAHNLAVLQTIVSTCQLHGVNPYEYLRDILLRVQTHPASQLDEILPQNWAPPEAPGAT